MITDQPVNNHDDMHKVTDNMLREVGLTIKDSGGKVTFAGKEPVRRHCQTNLTEPAKGADLKRSGCKLTPFRECGSAVLFEDVAAVEMAVEVEMVVD